MPGLDPGPFRCVVSHEVLSRILELDVRPQLTAAEREELAHLRGQWSARVLAD